MENSTKNSHRNYSLASNKFISHLREEEKAAEAEKMKQLHAAGHCCLTCNHTKTALGKRLLCKIKGNKLVQHYNLCPNHTEIRVISLESGE